MLVSNSEWLHELNTYLAFSGRAPGQKFKITEVMVMMKRDPSWSVKASEMDEVQQEELCMELAEKRKQADTAICPSRLSRAKTADILLKKVDADVS